jgi:hypothetical protein
VRQTRNATYEKSASRQIFFTCFPLKNERSSEIFRAGVRQTRTRFEDDEGVLFDK